MKRDNYLIVPLCGTKELTSSEKLVYGYLVTYCDADGNFKPSDREITDALGFKCGNYVSRILGSLARKGLIRKEGRYRSRSIHVL